MKKILLDMSNVIWTSLLAGKDTEGGKEYPHPTNPERKPVWVNSAEFGFENAINMLVSVMHRFKVPPKDLVMVWEGRDSKTLRRSLYPEYKAGRDDGRPAEAYVEFDRLAQRLREALMECGAISVHQDGIEADDVIAYLAGALRCEKIIVSTDGDMLPLVNATTHVWNGSDLDGNKYGSFPNKYVTLYKALVGDTSDNIKGAKGFGDAAFLKLYVTFAEDGLDLLTELIEKKELDKLSEDVGTLKVLQKIIDSKESVYTSWAVASMYPEKVNTMRKPLVIAPGMVEQWDAARHDARLKPWLGRREIVYPDDFDKALRTLSERLPESAHVSLDIETSTPQASDDWLDALNRKSDEDADRGVDVLGSELTSLSLTFGDNNQYTLYFPVEHAQVVPPDGYVWLGESNVTSDQVKAVVQMIPKGTPILIQNVNFELTVLFQEWGFWLPDVEDTKFMASYVDENSSTSLKPRSKRDLGYDQVDYATVTQGRKMNQLTAEEAFAYGTDDTICTAALFNYYRFVMEIENTYDVYREVEIDAAYLKALAFVQGCPMSMERMLELRKEDAAAAEKGWTVVRDYLLSKGWEGSVYKPFELTAASIKEAYTLVTGEVLKTQVRTPSKLVKLIEETGEHLLSHMIDLACFTKEGAVELACQEIDKYLKVYFKGEPDINFDSPKQMQKLLYEVMGLPIRVRNKPTPDMRKAGLEGSPKTDELSLQYVLKWDSDRTDIIPVIKALQAMKIAATREKMFYKPYENIRHWKTGLIHPNVNQSAANTRRDTTSKPNTGQLPKHPKADGEPPKFRETYVPHRKGAVVVSIDFSGQELRIIADYSKDKNMLACFVGDHLKDMHGLTGVAITHRKPLADLLVYLDSYAAADHDRLALTLKHLSYDEFMAAYFDKTHPLHPITKAMRPLGKKTNFTTEYGAMAPKLAQTLIISEEEAQQYIDAKLEQFPEAEAWKKRVVENARSKGYETTMMGARRHLADAFVNGDRFTASKAERQAVNFKVQSSSAEQIKTAQGRIWRSKLFERLDARFYFPIYDELVFSVMADQAVEFITEVHPLIAAPYGGMVVPIVASISLGPSFGKQFECGDFVDPAAIRKALAASGFEMALAA